ncbi:hypothetical protein HK405_014729 [Cladochytrium tenue]|nr:hypothetical protein HK405_014729 [Cladochytrium tenue]
MAAASDKETPPAALHPPPPPATLYHNASFFVVDQDELLPAALAATRGAPDRFAECTLVDDADGRILYVGALAGLPPLHPATRRINLQGRLVVPSFIDSHTHLLMFGRALRKVDLAACTSMADIQAAIADAARRDPAAPRILAKGWMHRMTGPEPPTAAAIDAVVAGRPVYIESKDLHSHWCNSRAMEELGITKDGPADPDGGRIHRDPADGTPLGLMEENANITIVWPALARMASDEQTDADIEAAFQAYIETGVTGVVDMALEDTSLEALRRVKAKHGGTLPLRVSAHWLVSPKDDPAANRAQVERALELSKLEKDEWLSVIGIKLVCDGVIDACTAALKEPYNNGNNCGPMWPLDDLIPVVHQADAAGLRCALHAIGDQAVHIAVEALASLGPARACRHRIEHLELTDPADVARLGSLGITASIQPVHADPAILSNWIAVLGGPEATRPATRAFAYREMAAAGAPLAIGSDAPTAPHAPLRNLHVAVSRRSARAPLDDTLLPAAPEHALPPAFAFAAASRGGARCCPPLAHAGSLAPGCSADFVVVDLPDRYAGHPHSLLLEDGAEIGSALLEARVVATYLKGRQVFASEAEL